MLGRLASLFGLKHNIVAGRNIVGGDLVIGDTDHNARDLGKEASESIITLCVSDNRKDVLRQYGETVVRVFDRAKENVFGGYYQEIVVVNKIKKTVRVYNRRY